jgi:hypothetical protein
VSADGAVYLLWCGGVHFSEDRGRRPQTPTCVVTPAAAADEAAQPAAHSKGRPGAAGANDDSDDSAVRLRRAPRFRASGRV